MSQAPQPPLSDELPKGASTHCRVLVLLSEVQEQLLPLFLKVIDGNPPLPPDSEPVQECAGPTVLTSGTSCSTSRPPAANDEYRRWLDEQQRKSAISPWNEVLNAWLIGFLLTTCVKSLIAPLITRGVPAKQPAGASAVVFVAYCRGLWSGSVRGSPRRFVRGRTRRRAEAGMLV